LRTNAVSTYSVSGRFHRSRDNDWSSQQRANHGEIPGRAEVSWPCSPLFKRGGVYPSATTARIGPNDFGIDGPDCTITTPDIRRLEAIGARGTAIIRIIIIATVTMTPADGFDIPMRVQRSP
jgi:hypothetical protein